MLVPRIQIDGEKSFSAIEAKLDLLPENRIAIINWSEFPEKPLVTFKIAHDGENIYLQYNVEEKEILAKANGNNSEVWTDSCVEFFISFDESPYYYNLEQSCIGQALLGYRKEKNDVVHASDSTLNAIKRLPSLGRENFELKKGEYTWSLLSVIPASTFWATDIKSFDGLEARANFYKCGDNLTTPHFLSWRPIGTEKPNFHCPQFFEDIKFGK